MDGDRPFWRAGSVLLSLGVLVVVVVLDVVLRHLGGTPAAFTLFLGRFHPLAVHLPIGFVLLVGAAEAATLSPRLRPKLNPGIGLALLPLVVVTAGTFAFGQMLARSGDFAPRLLTVHRRAELFAAIGICLFPLAWAYQEHRATPRARWTYRALLGVTLLTLGTGAHFGGSLTHGDDYLTHYAPSPLRALLGLRDPKPAASASARPAPKEPHLFADVLQPILVERCAPCHGTEKVKAGLRLDSLAAILKGGEDGAVVTPGAPDDSELIRRVLLPKDDDDHMPPEDKPGLTPAEISLLRFWIERGADDHLLVHDLLLPPEARPALGNPPSPAPSTRAPTPAPSSSAPTPTSTLPPTPTTTTPTPAPAPVPNPNAPSVLAAKCTKCHGPNKQKSKLRLDSLDAMLTGGKSGPAIVPGNPSQSELIRRVTLPLSSDKHMPPEKETQLTPSDLSSLSTFIRSLSPSSHPAPSRAASAPAPPASPPPAPDPSPDSDPDRSADPDPSLLSQLPPTIALYPSAIAPLLTSHCSHCHSGPHPAGALSVSSHSGLLRGGNTAPAVVAGDPTHSVLVARISLPLDDGDHMPPEGEKQLSADAIALVAAWVEHGASEQGGVETRTLPPAAVRALAARSSEPHEPQPSEAASTPALASLPTTQRSGGCAACSLPERSASSSAAPWLAGVVGAALFLRRSTLRSG